VGIQLKNIIQKYKDVIVVKNVELSIEDGEMIALLGPSGCGKTTLLKTIAGLLPLEQGTILLDDRDISKWPPQERNTAMVFQNYALFPHMTVEENIAYGLKIKKIEKHTRKEKVEEILSIVELLGYNHRKISELSGGQQQRVALARALVTEPKILLFDEPLSNLDEKLRVSMRQEIRKIQQAYGITSIYVTHDQEEAMAIADRIVVMKEGIVQQIGSPIEVYMKPINRFVAEFMGIANIVEIKGAEYKNDKLETKIFGSAIEINGLNHKWNSNKNRIHLMFRPENVEIREDGQFEGTIKWLETIGSVKKITIGNQGDTVIAEQRNYYQSSEKYAVGGNVRFDIDVNALHVLAQV